MSILKQLWITGALITFCAFGVKTGLGLGAQIYSRTVSSGKKVILLIGCFSAYLILFLGLYHVITHYGRLLYFAGALGLFLWGIRLAFQNPAEHNHLSFGAGLFLILPGPVCAMVILFNLILAYSLFSLSPFLITLILFVLFSGILFVTSAIIFPFRHKIGSWNSLLGISMALIGLYFFFTFLITPIYPEIKAAFTMAASNSPVSQIDFFHTAILGVIIFILGSAGFIKTYFAKGEIK